MKSHRGNNLYQGTVCSDRGDRIHVKHFNSSKRESYDVPYGKDIDNWANAIGDSHHFKNQ